MTQWPPLSQLKSREWKQLRAQPFEWQLKCTDEELAEWESHVREAFQSQANQENRVISEFEMQRAILRTGELIQRDYDQI